MKIPAPAILIYIIVSLLMFSSEVYASKTVFIIATVMSGEQEYDILLVYPTNFETCLEAEQYALERSYEEYAKEAEDSVQLHDCMDKQET